MNSTIKDPLFVIVAVVLHPSPLVLTTRDFPALTLVAIRRLPYWPQKFPISQQRVVAKGAFSHVIWRVCRLDFVHLAWLHIFWRWCFYRLIRLDQLSIFDAHRHNCLLLLPLWFVQLLHLSQVFLLLFERCSTLKRTHPLRSTWRQRHIIVRRLVMYFRSLRVVPLERQKLIPVRSCPCSST